jgi:hypothetical protein
MSIRRARVLALVAIATWVADPGPTFGAGSSVAYPKSAFLRLLAKGERPEILSCMVAGQGGGRGPSDWTDLRFGDDVSRTARVRDEEVDGRLVRHVDLRATARHRGDAAARRMVRVSCEQVEAQPIDVVVHGE